MKIIEPFRAHPEFTFEYQDADSFDDLEYAKCKQVYGVCFCAGKLVIGFGYFGGEGQSWGLIGGRIEEGETFEQTLRREIQEESNMEIVEFIPVGYQKVVDTRDQSYIYQLRYACIVVPIGEFVSDPAGTVTEIKLINPENYIDFFDWGQIGERLITRSTEWYSAMTSNA